MWTSLLVSLTLAAAQGPGIDHTPPPSPVLAHEPLVLAATIVSRTKFPVAKPAAYLRVGTGKYRRFAMAPVPGAANQFAATIPGEAITGDFDYYLEAFDKDDNGPTLSGDEQHPLHLAVAVGIAVPAAPPTGAPATAPMPSATTDDGPSADEQKLLLESVLPSERPGLQKALGSVAKLPLYRVQASIDVKEATFSGEVQIRYPAGKGVGSLPLRLFANASYVSHGSPAISVDNLLCPGQPCTLNQPGDATLLVVKYDPPLPEGAVARVNLTFHGSLPHLDPARLTPGAQMSAQAQLLANRGGGVTDHGSFAEGEGVLSLTGMFPQVAQRTADGFDTGTPTGVGDVSTFDLSNYLFTARTAGTAQVVAGGSKLGEAPTPDGKMQTTYAAAAVRDLPIYASEHLVASSAQSGQVKVTAYALEQDAAAGKKVLDVAVRALKDFSHRFGNYPWRELKVVEQPLTDGASGVEHPTAVSVGTIVYRSQNAMGPLAALAAPQPKLGSHDTNLGVSDKVLEFAVAHVIAHQWWGGMLGSDSRLDPAADEPLTQYSAILYLETRRGAPAAQEALDSEVAVGYQMMRQAGEPDGSADQPTGAFSSPLQFAGLIYGKAPLFYRAARKQLGDATFNKALSRYGTRYRFHTVDSGSFVEAVRDVAPKQAQALADLREHWMVEMHGDADIGKLDFGKVLESSTGMKMSPQEKAMMQQLMPQLMQMMKNGADPGALQKGGLPPGMPGNLDPNLLKGLGLPADAQPPPRTPPGGGQPARGTP